MWSDKKPNSDTNFFFFSVSVCERGERGESVCSKTTLDVWDGYAWANQISFFLINVSQGKKVENLFFVCLSLIGTENSGINKKEPYKRAEKIFFRIFFHQLFYKKCLLPNQQTLSKAGTTLTN